MLTVPKSELSFSLFFLFLFSFFFFSFLLLFFFFFLFHLLFRIIFIQNIIYFLDEESSGLVTCSMWLHSNGLFHRKKPKTQVTQDVENLDFLGILKKKTCGNFSGQLIKEVQFPGVFPWVLAFDLRISTDKGCHQHSNFSSKAVGKIIAEVEAKKILFASAVPRQFFCRHNRTNLCICLGNSLGSLRKLLRQCCFI